MEDLSYFLKDYSVNDKQLVKDLSVLIKNHRDSNKPIDKKFIIDIVKTIQSNDPDLSLDEICFCEGNPNDLAAYGDNKLYIIMTSIINEYNNKKSILNLGHRRLNAYFLILSVIIHELTHLKQDCVAKNAENKYYQACYDLCYENFSEYEVFYNQVPIERYAELRGVDIAYQTLSYIYEEEKLFPIKIFKMLMLIRGYEYDIDEGIVYSPIEIFDEVINVNNLIPAEIEEEYNELYNRLYIGLHITEDELLNLEDLIEDMYQGKHKNKKVKELINKIN